MYRVVVTEEVHNSIKSFIDSYRNTFLSLFSDTWIFDEELIRNHYIHSSEKFQSELFNLIEESLKYDIVFWRKEMQNSYFQLITDIWNYKLFLHYSEDNKNKIRCLEDLELHKK